MLTLTINKTAVAPLGAHKKKTARDIKPIERTHIGWILFLSQRIFVILRFFPQLKGDKVSSSRLFCNFKRLNPAKIREGKVQWK